ncbi:MAG: histidinol phosphate phosphatase [Proteobacteria bacterium]|nr:histidinol phosphate phosphatase [Pseudomonadota bacterium]MCP4919678.1 histidinol phosphate phosphatase [Pseudomonadota bacterium]
MFESLATLLADAASQIVREGYDALGDVEGKADGSPVTAIDRAVELRLRDLVAEHAPDHGFIGEEFPPSHPEAEHVWIVDPVDGTRPFIAGMPTFGVLIALRHRQRGMVLGVVDQPLLRQRWVGVDGQGCTRNGEPVHVRPCASLGEAFASTSGPLAHSRALWPRMECVHKAAGRLIYGGECLAWGLLAQGRIDLVVDAGLQLYDVAGPLVVLREAGATVTDWSGRPLGGEFDGTVLAAGDARVHAEALELIQRGHVVNRP